MKPRNLLVVAAFLGLLAPASLLAADAASDPAAVSNTAAAPAKVADAHKPKAANCDRVTGSIIRPSAKRECKSASSQPMRTYTQEDIQRTGEMDVANALRKLDPSIH